MGAKRRDHFNPVLLQKRFADPAGRLYFFDKRRPELGIADSAPRDLFVRKHLYSNIEQDGTKKRELDDFYMTLESRAAPIIEKIITAARQGRPPMLSRTEKSDWDLFVYNQWKRVPDSYRRFAPKEQDVHDSLATFEQYYGPLPAAQRAHYQNPQTIEVLVHNISVDALKVQSEKVLQALGSRGLAVAAIKNPRKSFVTGSFPVVKMTGPDSTELSHPSTEVWLAIAADVAVTPAGARGEELSVAVPHDHHIRALNEAVFRQSTVIAGRSPALIASLAGIR